MQQTWQEYWANHPTLTIEHTRTHDSYYRLLKQLINTPEKNPNIIEAGCGSGIRTLTLLDEFKELKPNAVLVDFSRTALAFARENARQNKTEAQFVLADILNLPFPSETYDLVWNEGVCEHFEQSNRYQTFEEMARICKTKGQVTVIVPNALNLPYRIDKKFLEITEKWQYGFEKPFSIFELSDKLVSANLHPNNKRGTAILTSILKIAPKKTRVRQNTVDATKATYHSSFKKAILKLDSILEKTIGKLQGENIGIQATKNGQKRTRPTERKQI